MWNQNRQKIKNSTVIYRAYKDSIFKVAMHYAKCEDLANEITQKTFFQLYIYFENVNLDNVYPWLVTTARNFTFNYNRDKKREILGEVFEVLKETKDKFCNINNMEEYYLRTEQKRRQRSWKIAFLNVYIKTTEYGMMQLHKCIVLENRNKRQQNN